MTNSEVDYENHGSIDLALEVSSSLQPSSLLDFTLVHQDYLEPSATVEGLEGEATVVDERRRRWDSFATSPGIRCDVGAGIRCDVGAGIRCDVDVMFTGEKRVAYIYLRLAKVPFDLDFNLLDPDSVDVLEYWKGRKGIGHVTDDGRLQEGFECRL
ncbi:hypothetical protein QQ045_031765 [Rhodiola kirilowii]